MSVSPEFSWRTTGQDVATLFKDQIKGKVVLITGVSPKSMGTETVRVMAPYAKTIIVASRSITRANEALAPVRSESPKADIRVVELDLADGSSIRKAGAEILALNLPINVLLANAAVPMYDTLERTKQGFEAQFGANHLGHFLLASLLLPALRRGASPSSPARVVAVSSVAITFGGGIRWDDSDFTKNPAEYSKYPGYIQSKLANVLFAKELTKRFQGEHIIAFSLHPGAIWDTNIGASVPKADLIQMGLLNEQGEPAYEGVSKTIPQGAATSIAAAFDPTIVSDAGAYLDDCVVHNDKLPESANDADATKLWELSETIWGQKFDSRSISSGDVSRQTRKRSWASRIFPDRWRSSGGK